MPLNDMERTELLRFRDRVRERLGGRSVQLTLFGSKARGDDRPDSDLDVLVITSKNDWRIRNKIYSAATDALLDNSVLISPKTLSRRQFQRLKQDQAPFIINVMRDGVKI